MNLPTATISTFSNTADYIYAFKIFGPLSYSTIPNGSLFIRTLCDILTEPNLVKQFDISQLMIRVLNRVSKIRLDIDSEVSHTQMPCFHMQL